MFVWNLFLNIFIIFLEILNTDESIYAIGIFLERNYEFLVIHLKYTNTAADILDFPRTILKPGLLI